MNRVACLVDKLLGACSDPVGVTFKHSPSFRREELVDRRLVHERLLVLEEADNIVDELARMFWRRIVETADSFLEQNASDR